MSALIFAFWLILNARVTLEVAVIGLVVTLALTFFSVKFLDWSWRKEALALRRIPLGIWYLLTLIWEIVKANACVGGIIYRRKPDPVIVTFRTKLSTRLGRAMLANSITLTPGTVTLRSEGDCLTVHCLVPELAGDLENSSFERRLLKLEAGANG